MRINNRLQTKFLNWFYHFTGIGFLFFSKTKNVFQGYSSPKPFSLKEYERAIEYDIKVVDNWLSFLEDYIGEDNFIVNKNILELGPGEDLGVGLYLLSKGIARYNAIDVNPLAENTPSRFYELFFEYLKKKNIKDSIIDFLQEELYKTQKRNNNRLNYICRDDFDITIFGKNSIDIIFSQATFEHFENVENVISQLSYVAKAGAVIIAEIDLKTHSRWIRDRCPNNIYRYSDGIYNLFNFRGRPNRLRPYQYKKLLEKDGWENVIIIPLETITDIELEEVRPYLDKKFHDERNQMTYLSIILCATKT